VRFSDSQTLKWCEVFRVVVRGFRKISQSDTFCGVRFSDSQTLLWCEVFRESDTFVVRGFQRDFGGARFSEDIAVRHFLRCEVFRQSDTFVVRGFQRVRHFGGARFSEAHRRQIFLWCEVFGRIPQSDRNIHR
jgi:hypothetical protein